MSLIETFEKKGYWLGPIAGTYAWVVILVAAALNPWWTVFTHAFSDLGASGPQHVDPWLYNYVGMVPTGLLILAFSLYLFRISRNRVEKLGSIHFLVAGALLVGIGLWHQSPGPYPPGTSRDLGQNLHDLFSAWFFLQALLAGLTWGVGLRLERRLPLGLGMVTSTFGAWSIAVAVAVAFGPLSGLYSGKMVLPTVDAEVGMAIGGAIAALGAGLVARGRSGTRTEAWGIFVLMIGAVLLGLGAMVGFGHVPGAVGEAIGILAIDVWVLVMYFARPRELPEARTEPPGRALLPEEKVLLSARPSLLHAFQVPALALVFTGAFLFFYGDYFLTQQLVGLILGTTKVSSIAGPVLASYLGGYLLVVLGMWRWSTALPPWWGAFLLVLVISLPLVMIASWFSTTGDLGMLVFFLVMAALLPLALSLLSWRRVRFALTDKRTLTWPSGATGETGSLTRGEVSGLALRRGLFHRWFDVGDVDFLAIGGKPAVGASRRPRHVLWSGIAHPEAVLTEAERVLQLSTVRARRRRWRPRVLLVATVLVVPILLAVTLVPVVSVQETVNVPCAYLLGNLQATERNPWPYIHNLTLPVGSVHFRWWSGTGIFLIVGQLPVGLSYQNVPLPSNASTLPTDLTSSGQGNYTSFGGTSFAICISLASGTSASIEFNYASPAFWI